MIDRIRRDSSNSFRVTIAFGQNILFLRIQGRRDFTLRMRVHDQMSVFPLCNLCKTVRHPEAEDDNTYIDTYIIDKYWELEY